MPRKNKSVLGESFIFKPEVIDDIHIKSELGRYRMRGFSLFKKIPTWDDLTFMPGTLTRDGWRCDSCVSRSPCMPRAPAATVRRRSLYTIKNAIDIVNVYALLHSAYMKISPFS